MAITRLGGANAITGTLPAANINDTSIGNITALPAGVGGKVLQVVTATDLTTRSTSSQTFVTASNTMSVSITPSSTSSKILLISNFGHYSSNEGLFTIFRDSTNLATNSDNCFAFFKGVSYGSDDSQQASFSFLDSPSSTSALTYQVYLRRGASGTAYLVCANAQGVLTAMEIA